MSNKVVDVVKDNKNVLIALGGFLVVIYLGTNFTGDTVGVGEFLGLGNNNNNQNDDGNDQNTSNDKVNKYSSPPMYSLVSGIDYQAEVVTNYGTFSIDLYEEDTPSAVNNFVFLAQEEYYNNLTFHLVKQSVIQGGDPAGDGSGGPGYTINDEIDATALGLDNIKVKDASYLRYLYVPSDEFTEPFSPQNLNTYADYTVKSFYEDELGYNYSLDKGTYKFGPYKVAYANGGHDTNGSQFFITTSSFTREDFNGRYTLFGEIVTGKSVIDRIELAPVDDYYRPINDIVIQEINIIKE